MSESKLESVYNTRDVFSAEIIKGALESEGIRAVVDNEHQAGLSGVMEVHVLVASEDAAQARQFIDEHEAKRRESAEDATDE